MDRVLLDALQGAPKAGLEDGGALLQAVLDCLDLQPDRSGPVARNPVGFAPEVVLDFVRSITTLEADDAWRRSREGRLGRRLDGTNNSNSNNIINIINANRHLLDTSLEALGCDHAPVLLPLVAATASDPGVASGGTSADGQDRSLWDGIRHLSRTTSGDEERVVLVEALDVARTPARTETTEESTGPSELENLMETRSSNVSGVSSSERKTSKDYETQDSDERSNDSSNPEETSSVATRTVMTADRSVPELSATADGTRYTEDTNSMATRTIVTADRSVLQLSTLPDDSTSPEETSSTATRTVVLVDQSAVELTTPPDSVHQLDNLLIQTENESIDLITPIVSHLQPPMDTSALYGMSCAQHDILQEYATLRMQPAIHNILEPVVNQSFGSNQSAPYYYHNANFTGPEGEAYQVDTPLLQEYEDPFHFPPSNRCNDEVTTLLHDNGSPFSVPYAMSSFEQPASTEMGSCTQQADFFNIGSFPPSVDEKSFINFLFSNMSNDALNDKPCDVNQCVFQLSSTGSLHKPAELFGQIDQEPAPPDAKENSLLYQFVDPAQFEVVDHSIYPEQEDNKERLELATIVEVDHGIELAAELETFSSTQAYTDTSDDNEIARTATTKSSAGTLPKSAEASGHAEDLKTLHVFPLQIEDTVPEFLQLLQEKNMFRDINNNLVAESGQVLAPAGTAKVADVLSAEPERNYNVLKAPQEVRGWRKTRSSPISDGNRTQGSSSGSSSSVEEDTKPRLRNPRHTFFDTAARVPDSAPGGPFWSLTIAEWPPKSTGKRPAEHWLEEARAHTDDIICSDDVVRDSMTGPVEEAAMLQPMLSADDVIFETTVGTLIDQEDVIRGSSGPIGSENKNQDTKTHVWTGERSTRKSAFKRGQKLLPPDAASSASSTAETCPENIRLPASSVHQHRTVYHASGGSPRQENFTVPSEPQQYSTPSRHPPDLLSRGLHTEVPLSFAQEEIAFDCDAPLFPALQPGPSEHSVQDTARPMVSSSPRSSAMSGVLSAEDNSDGGNTGSLLCFDEVHPSAVRKTPTVRNLMPKISEEQVE